MFCGENVVVENLFFFFSLSSNDTNSSSELGESSILNGTEGLCLGVVSDVVVCPGKEKGEETSPVAEVSASSHSTFLTFVFGGGLEWRVLHVLFTTISSSSSSLRKTESHWDSGLLCGFWDAGVLSFAGAVNSRRENIHTDVIWLLITVNWVVMSDRPLNDGFFSTKSSSSEKSSTMNFFRLRVRNKTFKNHPHTNYSDDKNKKSSPIFTPIVWHFLWLGTWGFYLLQNL